MRKPLIDASLAGEILVVEIFESGSISAYEPLE
jgi:hypothetical protein